MGSRGALRQGKRLLRVSQAGVWTGVFMAALLLSPPWLFSPLLRQTLAEHQLCTEAKTVSYIRLYRACTVSEKASEKGTPRGRAVETRETGVERLAEMSKEIHVCKRGRGRAGGERPPRISTPGHGPTALGNNKNRVQIKIACVAEGRASRLNKREVAR